MIWPLEGANKTDGKRGKTKRNRNKTRGKQGQRQAGRPRNTTTRNRTRRDGTKAAAPTAKPQGGKGEEGEGEGEARGPTKWSPKMALGISGGPTRLTTLLKAFLFSRKLPPPYI